MLEDGEVLKTFRLDRPPERLSGEVTRAVPIFDHEKRFLTYEGPVNKGLGQVRIEERGDYETDSQTPTQWLLRLSGRILKGDFLLGRDQENNWTFQKVFL